MHQTSITSFSVEPSRGYIMIAAMMFMMVTPISGDDDHYIDNGDYHNDCDDDGIDDFVNDDCTFSDI